jgi:PPOX class probable F420-dependent enzyme
MQPPDVEAMIREARVAHFATVDEHGRPHVVPVCFAWRDGIVYIALDAKPKRVPVTRLRRVRNLTANPEVQLLIDRYDEDWTRLAYVQLRGHAGLIEPGPEHAQALDLLRAKYAQYRDMPLEDAPVIRIEVHAEVFWTASTKDQRPTTNNRPPRTEN